MSGIRTTLALFARWPTVLRTIRPLKREQALAQLRHALFGLPVPSRASGAPPTLAIDEPSTPFLRPPAHVKWLDGKRIDLLSTRVDWGDGIDWSSTAQGPLFAYHLHQHEYLRLGAFTSAERAKLLRDWIENHAQGIGWDPHPISLRLLCWGKLLTTSGALDMGARVRDEMLASMADQTQTLAQGLEVRLQANHLLSNLISCVFSGLLLESGSSAAWRSHANRLLEELDAQVRPDGGHEERSPMYHSLLLENILDLLNLCCAAPGRVDEVVPERLRETASRMLVALDLYAQPDGRISLFADSAFDIAAEPAQLRDYAARLGISGAANERSAYLPQTGYCRLSGGRFELIASVAGPSPEHQPGHAHCDALAFELCVDGERLVTDTGVFEYQVGFRRDRSRTTASHATLQIDAGEQAELWSAHRVGGRPRVEMTAWDASGSAEATCRGWRRGAPLHRRLFRVSAEGVSIVDRVEGASREIRHCLPIDPAWHLEMGNRRARATRRSSSGDTRNVEIELPDAFDWALERGFYYPSFGCEVERFVLVGSGSRCAEATTQFRCLD